jgi:hypothetical protein
MMLVNGPWGNNKTFKLIPLTPDSPYNEAIYDLDAKVLALIGKEKKQSLHMVPKMDENGDVKTMRIGRRANGKDYAEERKTLDTYYEYYLDNPSDIKELVNLLAINCDSFPFETIMESSYEAPVKTNLVTI